MSRDAFLSTLEEEEERKSLEDGRRKVAFASPRSKRFVLLVLDQVTLPVCCGERVVVGEEGVGERNDIRATKVSIPKDQVYAELQQIFEKGTGESRRSRVEVRRGGRGSRFNRSVL